MTYSARPYILAETTWKEVKDTDFDVAILPWGATEAHNYHMPYATDNYQADYIMAEAARIAWEAGTKPIVLPNVPFGVNTGQLDVKLCINMNPSTQYAVLKDVADVVHRAGIKKLVIFNGHGANNFKNMIRELYPIFPDLFICALNWFQSGGDFSNFFEHKPDHAGEMETSVMMNIAPQLVKPLPEAGDGAGKVFRFKAFQEGWVYSQRKWTSVTADTGVGNPYKATPEKGKRFLEHCIGNISNFLIEFSKTDAEDFYV